MNRHMGMALAAMGLIGALSVDLERQRHSVLMGMLPRARRPKWGAGYNRGTGSGADRAIEREQAKAEALRAQYAHTPNLARA